MKAIQIEVNYDFICPWCWIGQRNLAAALDESGVGASVSIRHVPFELNPSMPVEGTDRRSYRTRKFGSWARSQSVDAQVAAAGLTAGAQFNYNRVLRTPNTRLAHRLMQFAQDETRRRKLPRFITASTPLISPKAATSVHSTRWSPSPPSKLSTRTRFARTCSPPPAIRKSTRHAAGQTSSAFRLYPPS
ncbi:hypothetical protein R75461_07941 [Paraburkholderia nemoris]|nr:hypothetical protein R75461_07941 [Paraburkholderia nemoris]